MKHVPRGHAYVRFATLHNLCALVGARVLFYQLNRQIKGLRIIRHIKPVIGYEDRIISQTFMVRSIQRAKRNRPY